MTTIKVLFSFPRGHTSCSAHTTVSDASPSHVPMPWSFSRAFVSFHLQKVIISQQAETYSCFSSFFFFCFLIFFSPRQQPDPQKLFSLMPQSCVSVTCFESLRQTGLIWVRPQPRAPSTAQAICCGGCDNNRLWSYKPQHLNKAPIKVDYCCLHSDFWILLFLDFFCVSFFKYFFFIVYCHLSDMSECLVVEFITNNFLCFSLFFGWGVLWKFVWKKGG